MYTSTYVCMYVFLIPKNKHTFKLHYPVIIFKDNLLLSKIIIKCINLFPYTQKYVSVQMHRANIVR